MMRREFFAPSPVRVRALALVRVRRLLRSRRALLALALALLPWLAVDADLVLARLVALTDFTIIGLTVLAAGAVAEDLDGGQLAISVTHGARPVELLAGEAFATLAFAAGLVALQLPIALHEPAAMKPGVVLRCLAWLAMLLAGWTALMFLAATWLDGVGNAVAMIPLLTAAPLVATTALADRLPHALAAALRALVGIFPAPYQADAVYRAVVAGSAVPRGAASVLAIAPVACFALAALRLSRLEPAGRLAA